MAVGYRSDRWPYSLLLWQGIYLWEQGLPAMEAPRFAKDRIAPIAGKPCSHRGNPLTTGKLGQASVLQFQLPNRLAQLARQRRQFMAGGG